MLVLHIFVFIPIALWMLWRGSARSAARSLTLIDRIVLLYFAWAALTLLLNLAGLHEGGSNVPRLLSTAATVVYWVLPFVIGRLLFRADDELAQFLDGLVLGALVTCVVLLAGYAYTWFTERPLARYAIGQRSVLVLSFVSIVVIFFVPLRPKGYIIAFVLWLAVALSATRASLGQWIVALVPALALAGNFSFRQRSGLAALALAAVLIGSILGDTVFRLSWLLDTTFNLDREGTGIRLRVQSTDDSSNIRFQIWSLLAAKAFQDLPSAIFGFGQLGPSFLAEAFDYKGHRIEMFSAHSEYLDQILRVGTIGLLLFLLLLFTVLRITFHLRHHPAPLGPALYGLGFALLGVGFYSLWHESTRYPWFGVIFWLLAGTLSSLVARQSDAAAYARDPKPA